MIFSFALIYCKGQRKAQAGANGFQTDSYENQTGALLNAGPNTASCRGRLAIWVPNAYIWIYRFEKRFEEQTGLRPFREWGRLRH